MTPTSRGRSPQPSRRRPPQPRRHAGNRLEQGDRRGERGEPLLNLGGELSELPLQERDRGQDVPDERAMLGRDAPLQGPAPRRQLRPQPPPGQLGQYGRVLLARQDGRQQVAPAGPRHVAGHRAQLEGGAREHLVQAIDLLGALLHQRRAGARQLAPLADGLRRNEAGCEQPVAQPLGPPLAVRDSGRAPRHRLEVLGVDQPDRVIRLQPVEDRPPGDPAALQRHRLDLQRIQPIVERQPIGRHGPQRPHRSLHRAIAIRLSQQPTGHHGLLMHIQPTAARMDHVHLRASLASGLGRSGLALTSGVSRRLADGAKHGQVSSACSPPARGGATVTVSWAHLGQLGSGLAPAPVLGSDLAPPASLRSLAHFQRQR